MEKYLKQKIIPKEVDRVAEEMDFREALNQLKKAPVEMNSDLRQSVAKDLPVEKIDKLQAAPIKSPQETINKLAELRAKKQVSPVENVINYNDFKKPSVQNLPEKIYDAGAAKREYEAMKKASSRAKSLGKLGLIGGLVGAGLAGSADEALANAVIPGGLEGAGAGSDQAMADETSQLEMMAQSATDPQVRKQALLELLKNRGN